MVSNDTTSTQKPLSSARAREYARAQEIQQRTSRALAKAREAKESKKQQKSKSKLNDNAKQIKNGKTNIEHILNATKKEKTDNLRNQMKTESQSTDNEGTNLRKSNEQTHILHAKVELPYNLIERDMESKKIDSTTITNVSSLNTAIVKEQPANVETECVDCDRLLTDSCCESASCIQSNEAETLTKRGTETSAKWDPEFVPNEANECSDAEHDFSQISDSKYVPSSDLSQLTYEQEEDELSIATCPAQSSQFQQTVMSISTMEAEKKSNGVPSVDANVDKGKGGENLAIEPLISAQESKITETPLAIKSTNEINYFDQQMPNTTSQEPLQVHSESEHPRQIHVKMHESHSILDQTTIEKQPSMLSEASGPNNNSNENDDNRHTHNEATDNIPSSRTANNATTVKLFQPTLDDLFPKKSSIPKTPKNISSTPSPATSHIIYINPRPNIKNIQNALTFVCLAGAVNAMQLSICLLQLRKSPAVHFSIALKSSNLSFQGLYVAHLPSQQFVLIAGDAPKQISFSQIDKAFKYESAAKKFVLLPSQTLSPSTDAFTIAKAKKTHR